MKVLENKTTNIPLNKESQAKYSDLLFAAVNRPLSESISLSDMRKNLRIISTIEDANTSDTIEFSDEDFALVLAKVQTSTWNLISPELLDFADYVETFK